MSSKSAKAALKAAKAAIDTKNWPEAENQARTVLETDPKNYFAHLFLGRAYDGLGNVDFAAKAYEEATAIKPDEAQAWLGLRSLYEKYEKQGSSRVDEHTKVGLRLAEIYMRLDDAHKAHVSVDKAVDFARKHGGPMEYARALEVQLPSSPVYGYLEGRLMAPGDTYTRIAEIHEAHEEQTIKKHINERKTRLGATLEGVTAQVKQEVYGASPLEGVYQQIVDWTNDDERRRVYEEKLLQRVYGHLLVLPSGQKEEKREKVMKLAHDMVIIRHPFLLAWQIELEWRSSGMEVVVH